MQGPRVHYSLSAFGLDVRADFPLPGADFAPAKRQAFAELRELSVQMVDPVALPTVDGKPRYLRNLQSYDGRAFAMLEGEPGDVLFLYGRTVVFHLSADLQVLRCAAPAQGDRAWQRVLMDTVLWTVGLLRGYELLHASAVETGGSVVAFVSGMGGGKTSLALEWIRRGAVLFADDIVALDDRSGALLAYPGPPLMNVPLSQDGAVPEAETLAQLGDERWVRLDSGSLAAAELSAIVIVRRAPGEVARCEPITASSLDLLPYVVSLPHLNDRDGRRFELFSAVAQTTPILVLAAEPAVPPADLADLVEARLARR
jgi:hypothetical protein